MHPAPSHSLWEINRADGLGMKGQRLDPLGFGIAQVMAGWALDTLLWNSRGGVTPPPAAPPAPSSQDLSALESAQGPGLGGGSAALGREEAEGCPHPEKQRHTPLRGLGPAPSRFSRPKTQGLLGSSLWVQGCPRSREEVVRCWENTGEHGPSREACSADPGRRYPHGGGYNQYRGPQ